MQKSDVVDAVAARPDLSKHDAGLAVEAILETISGTLKQGEALTLIGFGKFSVSDRAARQGINPSTREPMQIAAARVPKFSAGAQLKAAVRGG